MSTIIGIDPGTHESALLGFDGSHILNPIIRSNADILDYVGAYGPVSELLAIEMVACYGMPVGEETFETCLWIGRFIQRWKDTDPGRVSLITRKEVKLHLCGSFRAKDKNVRRALMDIYGGSGAVGTKKKPGPLYGIKTHLWSALAVAHTAWHRDILGKEI